MIPGWHLSRSSFAKVISTKTRGREIPTVALDFWFLGPYGGITVLTDSDTLVMVCPINAIVVFVKS